MVYVFCPPVWCGALELFSYGSNKHLSCFFSKVFLPSLSVWLDSAVQCPGLCLTPAPSRVTLDEDMEACAPLEGSGLWDEWWPRV